YLGGIPEGSRAARSEQIYLNAKDIGEETLHKVNALNTIADARRQSLAQMALAWVLHNPTVTSAIIGASRVAQIEDSVAALAKLDFSEAEITEIEQILT